MFTDEELKTATRIIQRIAFENRVSEAQVRADMQEAINSGKNHPSPAVRAMWRGFRYAGAEPSEEEFILWAAKKAIDGTQSLTEEEETQA